MRLALAEKKEKLYYVFVLDLLRESMGSGTCEAVYEELVYKNTVASIGK